MDLDCGNPDEKVSHQLHKAGSSAENCAFGVPVRDERSAVWVAWRYDVHAKLFRFRSQREDVDGKVQVTK